MKSQDEKLAKVQTEFERLHISESRGCLHTPPSVNDSIPRVVLKSPSLTTAHAFS